MVTYDHTMKSKEMNILRNVIREWFNQLPAEWVSDRWVTDKDIIKLLIEIEVKE